MSSKRFASQRTATMATVQSSDLPVKVKVKVSNAPLAWCDYMGAHSGEPVTPSFKVLLPQTSFITNYWTKNFDH
jgi:hypothetical protein